MRAQTAVVALVAAGTLHCDWLMTIDADVRVEPAAMSAVQPYPQQLLLGHEDPGRSDGYGAYRLAVLCAPEQEAFVTRWHLTAFNGCGKEGALSVWLSPVDPALGLPCGAREVEGEFLGSSPRPAAGEPSASVVIFAGGGDCPKRADTSLVIEAPPAPSP